MRRLGIAICTLVATTAGAANAGVLLTAAAPGTPSRAPVCRLVNLGPRPVKGVQISLFRVPLAMPGSLYAESPVLELAPLQTYALGQAEPLEGADHFACLFEFAGSGKTLRGSLAIIEEGDQVLSEPAR
jgi:hypothetical protein